MDTHHVDDLCDRTDWIAASVELQLSQDEAAVTDAFGRIAILHLISDN